MVIPGLQLDPCDEHLFQSATLGFAGAGYVTARLGGKKVYVHRVILGAMAGEEVDHINGDKRDNRRSNLRIVTHAQNHQNRDRHPDRGVCYDKARGRWKARVTVNGREHMTRHATKEEAIAAAVARRALLMPFAQN